MIKVKLVTSLTSLLLRWVMAVVFILCMHIHTKIEARKVPKFINSKCEPIFGLCDFLLSIWSYSARLHHHLHYFSLLFTSPLSCLHPFHFLFYGICIFSLIISPPLFLLLSSVSVIWMGISRQSRSSELKCCDQLYLLPHELQREDDLCNTTMGKTVHIFQACCLKAPLPQW